MSFWYRNVAPTQCCARQHTLSPSIRIDEWCLLSRDAQQEVLQPLTRPPALLAAEHCIGDKLVFIQYLDIARHIDPDIQEQVNLFYTIFRKNCWLGDIAVPALAS